MSAKKSISFLSVSRRMTVVSLVLGVLFLDILPARIALAEPPTGGCRGDLECQQRLLEALRLFNAHDYEKALDLLKTLYYQKGEVEALYPIALTLLQLGKPEEALPFCQKLLDAGVVTDPKELEKLQKLMKTAEEAAGLAHQASGSHEWSSGDSQAPPPELPQTLSMGPLLPAPRMEQRSSLPLYKRWQLWIAVGSAATAVVMVSALGAIYAPPAWLGTPTLRPFQ